jgi:hypothetical protein
MENYQKIEKIGEGMYYVLVSACLLCYFAYISFNDHHGIIELTCLSHGRNLRCRLQGP